MDNIIYNKAQVADAMELPMEFMDQLIEELFKVVDEDMLKLRSFVEIQDIEQIKFVLHSIKGAVANLQMNEITNFVRDEESNIDNNIVFDNSKYNHLSKLISQYKAVLI